MSLLALLVILSGCGKTVVKIVSVDSFCSGKYKSLWIKKSDFDNLGEIRLKEKNRATMDKYIDYHAINEKEFKICEKK